MPSEIDKLISVLREHIKDLTHQQAEALAKIVVAGYLSGWDKTKIKQAPTDTQIRAVQQVAAQSLGYLAEFNTQLGQQVEDKIQAMMLEGKGYRDIREDLKPFIRDVFSNGKVTIDHTGEMRQVVVVAADGSLSLQETQVTRPYTATVATYAETLSRRVIHTAYERGRADGYQAQGITRWRFVGPIDPPRVRPHHAAVVGKVYEYGTLESDLALQLLEEPNCRHRAIPYFDDPALNTPEEFFEKQKANAGLVYEDGAWVTAEAAE